MLPLLRNPATLPSISVVYSGWSTVVFTSTTYLLFTTEKYLKFGSYEVLPLYGVYLLSEFLKWAFLNSKFYLLPPYRPKQSSGVVSELVHSLKTLNWQNLIKGALFVTVGVICYFIGAILFGAAILETHLETFMFSLLMSILTVLPVCLNLGPTSMIEFMDGIRPSDEFHWLMYYSIFASWIGAWLGAIVIPLDWNRPWQEWPVPCNIGAVFALAVYHFFACVWLMTSYKNKLLYYTS